MLGLQSDNNVRMWLKPTFAGSIEPGKRVQAERAYLEVEAI